MIHQPLGRARGQVTDIQIAAKESLRIKEMTASIISKHTGHTSKRFMKIQKEIILWKVEAEAMAYGLVDQVIYPAGATTEDK